MKIDCLDKGFVRLVDAMGDDSAIVQSARVSYGDGTKSVSSDRNLIRYLMRHEHGTPFEMCQYKFHVRAPLFVVNQWVRHRTWKFNMLSGRYSVMPEDCYVPDPKHVTLQDPENKQGGTDNVLYLDDPDLYFLERNLEDTARTYSDVFEQEQDVIKQHYKTHLDSGMRRELARINLPLSQFTEFYASIDLRNLMHFIRLRIDSHAQYEIRVFAEALLEIMRKKNPIATEAFEDYMLNSIRLTRTDIDQLQSFFRMYLNKDSKYTMLDEMEGQESGSEITNKREYKEFVKKVKLILG